MLCRPPDQGSARVNEDLEEIEEMRRIAGDSFFVFHPQTFTHNIRTFLQAFTSRHPDVRLGYSYKTNYTPRACMLAAGLGAYAEVVSDWEYDMALAFGVSERDIIFNGPNKSEAYIRRALGVGLFHADNPTELEIALDEARRRPGEALSFGIRLNFPIDDNPTSRFGVDPDDPLTAAILERILRTPNLRVNGLHCHFSTRARSLASFAERTRKLCAWAKSGRLGPHVSYLDVGGGFFGPLSEELRAHFGLEAAPSYDDYATAIVGELYNAFPERPPRLILEPGAALVADAFSYWCRVKDVRNLGDRAVALTTGSYQLIRPASPHGAQMPFVHVACGPGERRFHEEVMLTGYTCMESDVMATGRRIALGRGDMIGFRNVGAYTLVFKPPFIGGAPGVIEREGRSLRLIRGPEDARSALRGYLNEGTLSVHEEHLETGVATHPDSQED
jgi:diaminopimelate decarboxylase